jgi:hypothetical protein
MRDLGKIGIAALLCLTMWAPVSAGASTSASSLDQGYRDMYNLDFPAAHNVFQAWQQVHPEDPLGPVSDAAAYLFSEFDRLHILEADLFTDNKKFEQRQKVVPDPTARSAFEDDLSRGDRLALNALSRSPQDANALFARILANGLRGDYLALIEKRNLAGLNYMKTGRVLAQQLLALEPSYYDAYLAVGVENYLLGINPAPVRWVLRLTGAQTDKVEGIAKLRLTAEKGHYLAPFARLLLAVAALRDHDRNTAKSILASLSQEFPQNGLYRKELDRLEP